MSPETEPAVQFQLANLSVIKAVYVFKDPVASDPGETRPMIVNLGVEIAASVELRASGKAAFVRLDTEITPDPKWQPYQLEVSIAAAFASPNASEKDMLTFCQVAAPSILFPYIREMVNRLTMDAPFGSVRLNPMNVAALLNETDWQISRSDPSQTSSEPQPPSEQ